MTKATQSDPTPAQVTMTLAAIAATAATPRPSGETLPEQAERARRGIEAQLKDSTLATGGKWALRWLALSPDNANLAYIASNSGLNQFAVVVRGTIDNPIDMMEDLDVGTVVPFTAGGSMDVAVSAGAMAAFTQIATARGNPGSTTLTQALKSLLASAKSQPTVYVTGHSLGGCIATMLATYLQAQPPFPNNPKFALITFAAPTAGLKSFADYVDSRPWSVNERYFNKYDVVPQAWVESDLVYARDHWYWDPKLPGPKANGEVKGLLDLIIGLRKGNDYVQPGTERPLNPNYSMLDKKLINETTADFLGQVAFQHANSTYLTLLDAPVVAAGPVVTGLNVTAGKGGTQVIITGSGFDKDSGVDFGPIPCANPIVDPSGKKITVTAPDGTGIVDVRVTTNLGTSPAVLLGQFAYDGGPAPVVVSAVSPPSGRVFNEVTITGSGFAKGATVRFKDKIADRMTVQGPTLIVATVPGQDKLDSNTVDVTVTVGVATSPTSPHDEFTYEGL
ncbi:IPT/TIG domain-containing protein [Streptomyces sp. NPDC020801]|uniref:lipase family protein n=1 Tax=unclassified Streptomyces TaxID=2593676 RepID=UPI003793287A